VEVEEGGGVEDGNVVFGRHVDCCPVCRWILGFMTGYIRDKREEGDDWKEHGRQGRV